MCACALNDRQAASETAQSHSAGDEVWVHPETLAVLDGAVLSDVSVRSSSGLEPPVAAIWRVSSSSSESSAAAETDAPLTYVLRSR